MSKPRVLVVTSCTGEKQFKPEKKLTLSDFKDTKQRQKREAELSEFSTSAAQMYTGRQHLLLMEGVNLLRDTFGKDIVDVLILSAGYGLISEKKYIAPYEVTFNNMKPQQIDDWGQFLEVHETFQQAIEDYDLIFLLLSKNYLRVLNLPVTNHANKIFIFLASKGSKKFIQRGTAKNYLVPLSNQEAKKYGCGLVGLKGLIFKKFAQEGVKLKNLFQKIYDNPASFTEFIVPQYIQLELPIVLPEAKIKSAKTKKRSKTYSSHKYKKGEIFPIPQEVPPAPNLHYGMQYFIPEWDDRVDPHYNFITDTHTPGRDSYADDVYAHEIYPTPNYDGILVSKVVLDSNRKQRAYLEQVGIHKFLRFSGEIMGDCGAFGYIKDEAPPFKTDEILEYYEKLGFNYGVSIDHLIVGDFAELGVREKRYELTLNNAQDFIRIHRQKGYKFTPIGVAQGWSPSSYSEAVKEVISMGYDYIALGGLARSPSTEILEVLKAVYPHLTPNTRLHLFGVARLNTIAAFRHLGVTSCDSASVLRKAWLSSDSNYQTANKYYAAVRLPEVKKTAPRIKRIIEAGVADYETLVHLEKEAISALRAFDAGNLDLETTLKKILAYDDLLELPRDGKVNPVKQAKRRAKHEILYRELLSEQPWKKCGCQICSEIGIEVVIFRNNNRNRRRGFHNTYIFYQKLQEVLPKLDNINFSCTVDSKTISHDFEKIETPILTI